MDLFLRKVIFFLKAFTKDIGKRKLKHSDNLLKVSITIDVECSNILEKMLANTHTHTHTHIHLSFFPCVQKWSISLGVNENIVEFCKDLDIKF